MPPTSPSSKPRIRADPTRLSPKEQRVFSEYFRKYLAFLSVLCYTVIVVRRIADDGNSFIWRRIEVVITGLTRNQFASNRAWVRLPPSPPYSEKVLCIRAFSFFIPEKSPEKVFHAFSGDSVSITLFTLSNPKTSPAYTRTRYSPPQRG